MDNRVLVKHFLKKGEGVEDQERQLKQGGLKLTPQRKAVLGFFSKKNSRKTPYEVHAALVKKIPRLGLPTVYRILEELKSLGLLIQLPSENRQLSYSLCGPLGERQHHHHFVCRKCKKTEEVDFCNFREIASFVRRKLGAKVESHSIQMEGLCAKCS